MHHRLRSAAAAASCPELEQDATVRRRRKLHVCRANSDVKRLNCPLHRIHDHCATTGVECRRINHALINSIRERSLHLVADGNNLWRSGDDNHFCRVLNFRLDKRLHQGCFIVVETLRKPNRVGKLLTRSHDDDTAARPANAVRRLQDKGAVRQFRRPSKTPRACSPTGPEDMGLPFVANGSASLPCWCTRWLPPGRFPEVPGKRKRARPLARRSR